MLEEATERLIRERAEKAAARLIAPHVRALHQHLRDAEQILGRPHAEKGQIQTQHKLQGGLSACATAIVDAYVTVITERMVRTAVDRCVTEDGAPIAHAVRDAFRLPETEQAR